MAREMTDSELAAMLGEHEMRSVGYYESEIAAAQADAIDRYYRRPYGDERAGRSKVVDATVAITVDNGLAAILKPFVSSDDTVVFEPRSEEDEEQARQATEYVNYVLHNDNIGFSILHDWFKDALLTKLGVVKVWWEDKTRPKTERLEQLDPMQLEQLMAEAKVVDGPFGPDEDGLYTLDVEREYEDGCLKVENIPPEEHRISPLARPGRIAPYEAHITSKARSDLVELGVDPEIVDALPGGDNSINEDARAQARRSDEDFGSQNISQPGDRSRELVQVNDEYALIDYDGDGISELRHVIRCGNVILFNEEVEDSPFARLCPVPMPHKIYGLSLADQVIDEQRIATVLWRQTLDNLYLANNPRPVIPQAAERDDGSTIDDLTIADPGHPIRVGTAELGEFAIPFVADKSFPMLDYVSMQAEARSGISKHGQGMDPDSIDKAGQVTATQSAIMEDGRNARSELIARIFAETGVKDLFKKMLRLLIAHQPRARMIRLRNKWVEMDPRRWNGDMDLSISVGLGIGNKAQQIAVADGVLATMAALAETPFASLIDKDKVYNAIKRKLTAAGIKNIDEFLVEPKRDEEGNLVPEPEQPDPETMKAQAELQIQQMKAQADAEHAQQKAQIEQMKAMAKAQIDAQKAQNDAQIMLAKMQLERERAASEADLAERKAAAEYELSERKMAMQESLAERDAERRDRETDTKLSQNRPGGDLDK